MSLTSQHRDSSRETLQRAPETQLERIELGRLALECAKLNPRHEQALAEEDMAGELWGGAEY